MNRLVLSVSLVIGAATAIVVLSGFWFPPGSPWLGELWKSWQINQAVRSANAPITFYGRVVDQDRNGIADVLLEARVSVQDAFNRSHGERITVKTDATGSFAITGRSGSHLDFERMEKSGYIPARGVPTLSFEPGRRDRHVADPKNPTIFVMWKQGPTVPLVQHLRHYSLIPDGRTHTLDLLKATLHEGKLQEGDLWIGVTRPEKITPFEPFDWSYRVEVVEGGYICTDDPLLYRAPKTGYQPVLNFQSRASDNPKPDPDRRVYIRSRNGKLYAGITLSIAPDMQGKAYVRIDGLINPAGSRNLEPDPSKVSRAGR